MINISEIHAGDMVIIRDPAGCEAAGTVNADHRTDTLWIRAFGVRLEFARHTAAGWHRVAQINVIAHQPELFDQRSL